MKTATETVYNDDWYENTELVSFKTLLSGVRNFMDVGASVGPYSKVAYFVMPEGTVTAVEANPRTFKELEEQVVLWRAEEDKPGVEVRCVNRAVSNEPGTVKFVMAQSVLLSRASFGGEAKDGNEQGGEEVDVESVSLDDLIGDGEAPDILKLDIEGYEYRAIVGAKKLLAKKKTRFLVEIHPWGDPGLRKRPSDVYELFMQSGYRFRRFHRHWLFEPGQASGLALMKQKVVARIMNHARLRRFLKGPAILLDKWTGK